jgi:hypothetical protein
VAQALKIEYCGEWLDARPGRRFTIGRDADLVIDDNPDLEAELLVLAAERGQWWLDSGARERVVQVSDPTGRVSAVLGPGDRVPVVVDAMQVVFGAGRTTYEFTVFGGGPYRAVATSAELRPGRLELPRLTDAQRLLLVVLCERSLRRPGAPVDYPTSGEAAARLGWTLTAFNRKLDNVCDRLDRAGVGGLRGGRGALATRRRSRLIEFALESRLVTADDLALLPGA